jgi:hypothetical protein
MKTDKVPRERNPFSYRGSGGGGCFVGFGGAMVRQIIYLSQTVKPA